MRREISSPAYTAITKLGFIIFYVFLFPIAFLAFSKSLLEFLIVTIILFPIIFFTIRWVLKFKQVEITEKGLIISHTNLVNRKEIFVPFSNVESVYQRFWQHFNPESVTISFTEPTEFGKKIIFIPPMRFLGFFEQSIVNELNLLIKDYLWREKIHKKIQSD
ncbi:MAG: hypothetical protein AAB336_00850 [Acidobacteriota bacterium]